MTDDKKDSSTTEFIKVVSGDSHVITLDRPVYRKIQFEKIKILDDTDYLSHGEFIFHLLVNKISMGKSRVIYANTGETLPYKWSMALKHITSDPLIVEFRVDELDRIANNTEVLRLSETYDHKTNFGTDDTSVKKYSYSNKYLSLEYNIQKLSIEEFKKLAFIEGSVKTESELKPLKDTDVKILRLSDNTLAKKTKTDENGNFKFDELDANEKYRIKTVSKGYTCFHHSIEEFHFHIDAVVSRLIIKGKVSEKTGNAAVINARVDLYKTMASVTKKINCYSKPDTKSTKAGTVEIGDYPVLEIKESGDTDYLLVYNETSDNDVWICSRWQKNYYALLFDKKVKEDITKTSETGEFKVEVDFEQLYRLRIIKKDFFDKETSRLKPVATEELKMESAEKAIEETIIVNRISDFKNFSYDLNSAYYPYELPDINIQIAPPNPKTNNCCTFAEGLVVKAWKDSLALDFKWSKEKHNQMMITTTDYYSPVTAIVDSKMGIEIDNDELPPPWTYVQGWKSQWTGGHTFLIIDVHQQTKRILTLESNKSYKMDGPGFRELGNIDDFADCNPGSTWWNEEKLWDWDKFKQEYKYRKMARLRIYDLKWLK